MDKKPKKPVIRLRDIRDDAQDAFWAEVIKHLPLAQDGAFDPDWSFEFDHAIENAIRRWWFANASEHYNLQ